MLCKQIIVFICIVTKLLFVSSQEEISKSVCQAKYQERKYLDIINDKKREPPVLYSFQGSGNTWSRLLIEYATGVYTGKYSYSCRLSRFFF